MTWLKMMVISLLIVVVRPLQLPEWFAVIILFCWWLFLFVYGSVLKVCVVFDRGLCLGVEDGHVEFTNFQW